MSRIDQVSNFWMESCNWDQYQLNTMLPWKRVFEALSSPFEIKKYKPTSVLIWIFTSLCSAGKLAQKIAIKAWTYGLHPRRGDVPLFWSPSPNKFIFEGGRDSQSGHVTRAIVQLVASSGCNSVCTHFLPHLCAFVCVFWLVRWAVDDTKTSVSSVDTSRRLT